MLLADLHVRGLVRDRECGGLAHFLVSDNDRDIDVRVHGNRARNKPGVFIPCVLVRGHLHVDADGRGGRVLLRGGRVRELDIEIVDDVVRRFTSREFQIHPIHGERMNGRQVKITADIARTRIIYDLGKGGVRTVRS